jgi:hypothetical protein
MNESAHDLDRVRETLNNEIKPLGMVEQLYLLDYAELTFEILRLRRWKMALLNTNFVPALETVFRQVLLQSDYNLERQVPLLKISRSGGLLISR